MKPKNSCEEKKDRRYTNFFLIIKYKSYLVTKLEVILKTLKFYFHFHFHFHFCKLSYKGTLNLLINLESYLR